MSFLRHERLKHMSKSKVRASDSTVLEISSKYMDIHTVFFELLANLKDLVPLLPIVVVLA